MEALEIPITPSTGEQDAKGIDFFLFNQCIPVDVTCNSTPATLTSKLSRGSATILFLPKFPKQQSIKQFKGREHILDHFLQNKLTPDRYLQIILTLNTEFKQVLIENLMNKYYYHKDLRLKKVKNRDIAMVDNMLKLLSSVL